MSPKPLLGSEIRRVKCRCLAKLTFGHLVILGKTVWAEGQIGAGGGQFRPLGPRAVLPS